MRISQEIRNQIESAYRAMSEQARYRPAAPSDGCGHITAPIESLNLKTEAAKYADWWWAEEGSCQFNIGCCDFQTRRATVYAVEAARQMCSGFAGDRISCVVVKNDHPKNPFRAKEIELIQRAAVGVQS